MQHDHDHDKQHAGAQTVRAIFAAQQGRPMASILNPMFEPADDKARAAMRLRRALGGDRLDDAVENVCYGTGVATLQRFGGLRVGKKIAHAIATAKISKPKLEVAP